MANSGLFAPELIAEGWFSPETQSSGWFDKSLLDSAANTANLSATETSDTAAGDLSLPTPFTLAATETSDTAAFTASGNIVFVGSQVSSTAGITTDWTAITYNLTGGVDTAPRQGDLVVLSYQIASAIARTPTPAITSPSGWTTSASVANSGTTYRSAMTVFTKFMGATPDTTVTPAATGDIQDAGTVHIRVYRGVDPTTPLDGVTPVTASSTGTGVPDPDPITPSTPGSWIIAFGSQAAGTTAAFTVPAELDSGTFRSSTSIDTVDAAMGSGHYTSWTSGAYNISAFGGGNSNAANAQNTAVLVLRPMPRASAALVVDEGSSTGVSFSDITDGGQSYRLASFTSGSGTLVVTTAGLADYLIVGGGGSGGERSGAGGGAGRFHINTNVTIPAGTWNTTVGSGGAGTDLTAAVVSGNNGNPTSFFSVYALGGGGGASDVNLGGQTGKSGGSGGGGTGDQATADEGPGGAAIDTSGGVGYPGGDGFGDPTVSTSGGGGGAGGPGAKGISGVGGAGGPSVPSTFTGATVYYAGGGPGDGASGLGSYPTGYPGPGFGSAGKFTGGSGVSTDAGSTGIVLVRWKVTSGGSATLSLSATETSDTATGTLAAAHTAALSATETSDTAAFTLAARHTATLSATETSDTAAFTAALRYDASLTATETSDTAAFTAALRYEAALSATETSDTAAFTAASSATLTLAATESSDTTSFSATLRYEASLSATEGSDTAAFTASASQTLTLSATETSDTAAFTLAARHTATLSATETSDTAAFSAALRYEVSLSAIETSDTAAFSAATTLAATLTATETSDTASISVSLRQNLSLAATETGDTAAFVVSSSASMTLAVTEARDTASFAVSQSFAVIGTTSIDGDYIQINLPAGLTNTIGTGNVTVDPTKVTVMQTAPSVSGTGVPNTATVSRRVAYKASVATGGKLQVWMDEQLSKHATSITFVAAAGAFTFGGSSAAVSIGNITPAVQYADDPFIKMRLVGVVKSRTELLVEHCVITGAFYLEADGGHESGVACVKFTVTDGITTVTKYSTQQERSRYQDYMGITDGQWALNCADSGDSVRGGLGVYSSGSTPFQASDFLSGPITVKVEAFALIGGVNVTVSDSWPLYNNTDGSYAPRIRYVDTVAGSDSNNGLTQATAFATLQKGIREAGGAAAGATARSIPFVYVVGSGNPNAPRRHTFVEDSSTNLSVLASGTETWLTIKPAPGYTEKDCVFHIDAGSVSPKVRRLKIESVWYDIRAGSPGFFTTGVMLKNRTSVYPIATNPAAIWLDKVTRYHSGGKAQNVSPSSVVTLLDSTYVGSRVICTNMMHRDIARTAVNTANEGFQRNIGFKACTGDMIKAPQGCIFGVYGEDNTGNPLYLGFDSSNGRLTGTIAVGDTVTGVRSYPNNFATVGTVVSADEVIFSSKTGTFKADDTLPHSAVTVADASGFVVGTTMTNGWKLYRKDGNVLRFEDNFVPSVGATITQASPAFSSTVTAVQQQESIFFSPSGARARSSMLHYDGIQIQAYTEFTALVSTVTGSFSVGESLTTPGTPSSPSPKTRGTFLSLGTTIDGRQSMLIQSGTNQLFDGDDTGKVLSGAAGSCVFVGWYENSKINRNCVLTNVQMFKSEGQNVFVENGSSGYHFANILAEQELASSGNLSQYNRVGHFDIWHASLPKIGLADRFYDELARRSRVTWRGVLAQEFTGGVRRGHGKYAFHAALPTETLEGDMTRGDPLYVDALGYNDDPDPLHRNYELLPGSPARRFAPLAEGAWKRFDLYGTRRPTNGTAAIGAIEKFPIGEQKVMTLAATENRDTIVASVSNIIPTANVAMNATEPSDTMATLVSVFVPSGSTIVVDEGASTGATFSTITDLGATYRLATFTSPGNLVVTTAGTADYLIVGGGGTGGKRSGGGGGAGGLLTSTTGISAGTWPVAVGAGGVGFTLTASRGLSGSSSSFLGVTAPGGGGGGSDVNTSGQTGLNGGSGGGGAGDQFTGDEGAGGASTGGGYPGGDGFGDPTLSTSGGGGGAGGPGGNGAAGVGGNGGASVQLTFTGTATYFAGGGAGSGAAGVGANPAGYPGVGFGSPGIWGSGSTTAISAGGDGRVYVRWVTSGGSATLISAMAATETSDTASGTMAARHNAALAATETSDTASFLSLFSATIDLAVTEESDECVGFMELGTIVTIAATETSDTAAFDVTGAFRSDLAVTEESDTAAFDAWVSVLADFVATETRDTAEFTGLSGLYQSEFFYIDTEIIIVPQDVDTTMTPPADDASQLAALSGGQTILVDSENRTLYAEPRART